MEKYFFICVSGIVFLTFGLSVRTTFTDHEEAYRFGYNLLKLANISTWVTTLILVFMPLAVTSEHWIAGTITQLFCLGFFFYLKSIAKRRLTIAFCLDTPTQLIKEGPYKYIRHPFYTCYLFSYLSVALVLHHPMAWFNFVFTVVVYVWAAKLEEDKFSKSGLREQYIKYRTEAGMFWPKFRLKK